jgi:aspartate/methionine/tyrosine aminotransferase
MMAGDGQLLKQLLRARANFGVGVQDFVQRAAIVAWNDDDHVAERRKIFVDRIDQMLPRLHDMGFECARPDATFYLWAKLPAHYKQSDVKFCMDLAEQGVIVSPSQWLSEGVKGYVRFALVPDTEEINTSCDILQKFLEK